MHKDWGYAALVEYGGKRMLFDTGNDPDILAQNSMARGMDLAKLDFVVMSHRHGDHMGGMAYLLKTNDGAARVAVSLRLGLPCKPFFVDLQFDHFGMAFPIFQDEV